jgi:putative transposase
VVRRPVKWERIYRHRYLSQDDARSGGFDYIERFHNPRMQQRLDHPDKVFNALIQPAAETG